MAQRMRAWMGGLTILVDIVAVALSYYAAYLTRLLLPWPTAIKLGAFGNYAGQLVIYVLCVILAFLLLRLYQLRRASSRIDLVYLVVSGVTIASLSATALSYLFFATDSDLTRGVFVYAWGFATILLLLGRVLTGWLRKITRRHYPVLLLLVGTGDAARMILQKTLKSPHLGYRVVGLMASGDQPSGEPTGGVPVLGTLTQLGPVIRQQRVEEVVIALPEASHEELLDIISTCENERATVRVFPDLFQIIASDLTISDLDGLPLLTVRDVALRGWKLAAKRTMDLVVSGIGLILVSPLLMFVALLVKLGSRGPVFYSQERVGLDGNPFPMLKFRSMRVDAERDTGPVWAVEDDPRRTRLGTFMRKTSIDELPQLINVLLGDMSLVGPRPERPVFVEQFRQVIPRYMERHKEKAGMTGWAQVNGLRGDTSIFERTKYDLYYIENWSLLFDLKIIIRQMTSLLRRDRHAY